MLGYDSLEEALELEPREMASVSPELWQRLRGLHTGGALKAEFLGAWTNGAVFLRAADGLRGRRPLLIEWKGAIRAPGDEVVPADLRVDHVYMVSCKYLSDIVLNASPSYVFDRLLVGGHGTRGGDWYRTIAAEELDRLFQMATADLDLALPSSPADLDASSRKQVARHLRGRWSAGSREEARRFAGVVAERTAARWTESLRAAGAEERVLMRLLRIGSAPYFVLGADAADSIRLRVETPWDWKQANRLIEFVVRPRPSEQPVVDWIASVEHVPSGRVQEINGHVEIRWAHGKFNGPPEAKVYLDTPHHRVPGYVSLA